MRNKDRPDGLRAEIRTIRWISQITFLAIWLFLMAGTVCTMVLGRGFGISEPLGVLQLILAQGASGIALRGLSITLVAGAVIFIGATILLGRAFCAWSCPLGTTIDLIDKALQKLKFKPLFTRGDAGNGGSSGIVRNEATKYAVLGSALAGSALFKFPVWCTFCPIGTLCRGAIAGTEATLGAEFLVVPVVGAMSLGQKRFWCRYLCPLGGLLTIVSRLNPFFKPKIKHHAQHQDCGACTTVCPEGINLCKETSLAKCTKCLECYAKCPFGSVTVGLR